MDVHKVVLQRNFLEYVYMQVPEGFLSQGEYSGVGVGVCKLHKSLYSLKQAPR